MKAGKATIQQLLKTTDDQARKQIQTNLLALPAAEHPRLRKQLIKYLQGSVTDNDAETRGWVINTLAKIVDGDKTARDVVLTHLSPQKETSKWVRYWALEGLWSGGATIPKKLLQSIFREKREPLVPLLARAIMRIGNGLDPKLTQALTDPELQHEALRALRAVPLSQYRDQVQEIEAKAIDEKIRRNAQLALRKMDENNAPSKIRPLEINPINKNNSNSTSSNDKSKDDQHPDYIFDSRLTIKSGYLKSTDQGVDSSNIVEGVWLAPLSPQEIKSALDSGATHQARKTHRKVNIKKTSLAHALLTQADTSDLFGIAELTQTKADQILEQTGLNDIRVFDQPIKGKGLQQILPEIDLTKTHQLTLLTDEQWSIARELIRFHQPKLNETLPLSLVDDRLKATIVRTTIPAKLGASESFSIQMVVQNTGNVTWPIKHQYRISGSVSRPDYEIVMELGPTAWTGEYKEDVPPGATYTLNSPPYNAPTYPGQHSLEIVFYGDIKSTLFTKATTTESLTVTDAQHNTSPNPILEQKPKPAPKQDPKKTNDGSKPILDKDDTASSLIETPIVTQSQPVPPSHLDPEVPREIIHTREQLPASPDDDRAIVLAVTAEEADLTFKGTHYYSDFRIPQDDLRARNLDPVRYGTSLFNAAFNDQDSRAASDSTVSGYREALRDLRKDPERHWRFEITLPKKLEYLNWECLTDPDSPQRPLSTNERFPFYRRVANNDIKPMTPPLKVLVAICSPEALEQEDKGLLTHLSPLKVAEERQSFHLGLEPLRRAGLAEYRILGRDGDSPVTLESITEEIAKGTHIIHLLAHGLFKDKDYYIVMARGDGGLPFVSAKELAGVLFKPGSPLRLAILVACESGKSDANPETGAALGKLLVKGGVPAVISMQEQLGLRSAQLFNQRFYFHLARSGEVDTALAATRFDLKQGKIDLENSWSTPVLHLGANTGKLFNIDEDRASRLEERAPQILSDAELRRAGRGGADSLQQALRNDPVTSDLPDQQLAAIGRAVREAFDEPSAASSVALAPIQNIASLQRQMPRRVRFLANELHDAVAGATQLKLPQAVFDQIASAINAGKHIVLIGPPGTGKTSLAHAICDYATDSEFSTGKIPSTASADWTTFDTVGGYVPTSTQHLEFRPGIFLRAISSGRWLVIDEINRAEIDKAVGELFTVLSGQQVDLPYRVDGHAVRILPFKNRDPDNWVPDEAHPQEYDYVVHPNWRILATMNIYDKSSLFSLSFAFMRRFAFIDVGVPDDDDFRKLRKGWIEKQLVDNERDKPPQEAANNQTLETACGLLAECFDRIFDQPSPFKRYRELGPAIAKDMIAYIGDRAAQQEPAPDLPELLAEAFLLYAVPQMDGLSRDIVTHLYCYLKGEAFAVDTEAQILKAGAQVLERIEALYPHIPADDWETAYKQWQQDNLSAHDA